MPELIADPIEPQEIPIPDAPPETIGEDTVGSLSEDGLFFITEDGHRYDLDGRYVPEASQEEPEPSPVAEEPAAAETAPAPPPYTPFHVPMDYTDQEKQWLQGEMASLDAERMFAAQDYMARKRADQMQQQVMATQAMTASDPLEPLTQKYVSMAIQQYGQQVTQNPKQLRSWAELQAVSELGAARGDIDGELARYYAKRFTPAPAQAVQVAAAPRVAAPPVARAVTPSSGPAPTRPMRQDTPDDHVKMLQERFGMSRYEAERAARETSRR